MGWTELAATVAGACDRLQRDAADAGATQQALLRDILSRHRSCAFARAHGFDRVLDRCRRAAGGSMDGLVAWRDAVPPGDYERFAPSIEAMAAGEPGLLVDEPLAAFERTGGSTGGTKLVPLTASGLALLRQGLFAWLDDLCLERPAVMAGTSYWSISPASRRPEASAGGIRIGLASDAEYFGDAAAAVGSLLCVPPAVAAIDDIEAWRNTTLHYLLADERLAMVSVWSPTFWTELCRQAVEGRERLVDAIASGRRPDALPPAVDAALARLRADPQRALRVDAALRAPVPDWAAIWPRLALLSCWTHASAAAWVPSLAAAFPMLEIQGKGLLATEAIVSVPLCDGGDPVAAVGSTVIEFEDDGGRCFGCHEVEQGGEYAVLVTTSAGLYRYRLGDRVRVTGHWQHAPRLRLLGRGTATGDLCGEKLDEAFVLGCWQAALEADGGTGGAASSGRGMRTMRTMRLVPVRTPVAGYVLVLDAADGGQGDAARLAMLLDERLAHNPQYAYARRLGQLAPVAACRVDRLAARLQALALAGGQRLGDAKPGVLGRVGEPDLASFAVARP